MTEQKLQEGDYVRVTEDYEVHGSKINAGSVWRLDQYVDEEVELDEDDNVIETYPAWWDGSSVDGQRMGFMLELDKIEKVTENIPFSVYAVVELEIYATVNASSEAEAIKIAKGDYHELVDNFNEMSGEVKHAHVTDL